MWDPRVATSSSEKKKKKTATGCSTWTWWCRPTKLATDPASHELWVTSERGSDERMTPPDPVSSSGYSSTTCPMDRKRVQSQTSVTTSSAADKCTDSLASRVPISLSLEELRFRLCGTLALGRVMLLTANNTKVDFMYCCRDGFCTVPWCRVLCISCVALRSKVVALSFLGRS